MSNVLASRDVANHGATFAGLSLVAMDYNVQDFVNAGFVQAEYNFMLSKGVPNWIVGANVVGQQSVGANLLTGISFRTYQASVKAQMLYAGWTLFVVGSTTVQQSQTYAPFGTSPSYLEMQEVSFNSANEKAIGGSIAYDFGAVGLSGVSAGAWYARGWDAINPSTNAGIPIGVSWTFG